MKKFMYIDSLRRGWRQCPPSLQVATTDFCYNACMMCGHWKRKNKQHLNLVKWLPFLEFLHALGLESVCYSGGDPMKHPEINKLMQWHYACDLPFTIITAGNISANVDLELLAHAKWVRVSLDTLDEDIYKKCRGGNIDVAQIKDSLRRAKMAGVNLQFNLTAHALNVFHLPEVFTYAIGIGATKITIKPVIHEPELALTPEQHSWFIGFCQSMRNELSALSIEHNLEDSPLLRDKPMQRCFACLWQHFIDANGDVHACCILAGDTESESHVQPLGNIFNEPWSHIWPRALKFHSRGKLREYCHANCIKRHYLLNIEVAPLWDKPSFF